MKDFGGHDLLFVRVPCLSSDKSFNNTKSWVDEALKNNGSTHDGTRESAFHVANHLCRFYQDSVCEALNQQGRGIGGDVKGKICHNDECVEDHSGARKNLGKILTGTPWQQLLPYTDSN